MTEKKAKSERPKVQVLYKQKTSGSKRNISPAQLKRKQEAQARATKTSPLMKWKKSDSFFYRGLYKIINGVWIGVVAVGSFIAWLISFLLF